MLNKKVNSSIRPIEVEVFPTKHCYMRKNIVQIQSEEGEYFEYDEVFFISDATKEEIEANFDTFWVDGIGYGIVVSIEERLDSIEETVEMLMEVMA